jgi:biopolymer transport protein ExbD
MRFRRKMRQRVSIDMTPMIDCVFLILIFFMLTSPLILGEQGVRGQGIQVSLPQARSADAQPNHDIVISISRDNVVHLNDVRVDKEALYDQLRRVYSQARQDLLVIRADEIIEYGVLVEVMDIARLAGIYNVSLSTKRNTQ